METTTAEALVDGEPLQVYAVLLELAAALWSVADEDIVEAQPGRHLIHGVRVDGETACWLGWELTEADPRTTHVRLVHDEADVRSGPAPDLDAVLDILQASVEREQRPAAPPRPGLPGES